MLRSFVKCQKDECDMTNFQNNTHLCGMSTHNMFLYKTSAGTVTQSHCAFTDNNQYQLLRMQEQLNVFL